jgi:ribonuclease T1
MIRTHGKQVILYIAAVLSIFLAFNLAADVAGCAPVSDGQGFQATSATQSSTQSGLNVIKASDLPPEGRATLNLIKNGGPFPYSKDGAVFNNYEGLLPAKAKGYYHEYTVITPGSSDRGARRIIAGANHEYYYTSDHYASFKLIQE